MSSTHPTAISTFAISVSLFDLKARFFAPTHGFRAPARAGTVKVGRRANLSPTSMIARSYLDGSGHDGTLAVVGMTMSRGVRCRSDEDIAPHACIRWTV